MRSGSNNPASTTTSMDAMSSSIGESLLALQPEQFGQLQAFVPDTPWTTTVLHVIQRKQGRVWVDSTQSPRNLVVCAQGDPERRTLDQAYLFGQGTSDALVTFVQGIKGPMELVCDDEVAQLVQEHHPDARRREMIVHWYERLEDADKIHPEQGPRRLRISEADGVAGLVPGWALRTFRTCKEMVTGGTAYVCEADGRIASIAFTVDQSVKYERISCATFESAQKRGLGSRAAAKVVRAVADQGRIPCCVVDRRDASGVRLAEKLGFTQRALMTTYTTAFRK